MTKTIIRQPQTAYTKAVAEAEAELRSLITEPEGAHSLFGTSFSSELAELAQEIESTDEEGGPVAEQAVEAEPPATLLRLRGDEVRLARHRIEDLLKVEARNSGLNFPRRYGPEILAAAQAGKRALEGARLTAKSREYFPAVITVFDKVINLLLTTPMDPTSGWEKYLETVNDSIERLRVLTQERPRGPATPSLYGLSGEAIRGARKLIEPLVAQAINSPIEDYPTFGSQLLTAVREGRQILSAEAEGGTPKNRQRLPVVLTELERIIDGLHLAEEELGAAPELADERVRWRPNHSRRAATECWGDVLAWSCDLLENFQQPAPDWTAMTPSLLAAELSDLADAQQQLQLHERVVLPLEEGDVMSAWIALQELVGQLAAEG